MRHLIIGLTVGLVMVMANMAYGATNGSSTATVDATITPQLVMSLSAGTYSMGALPIGGANEQNNALGVVVSSNVDYNIKVKSDYAYPKEYVTAAVAYATDTTRTVQYPLKCKETAQGTLVAISATEGTIQGCSDLEHTGNAGVTTNIDYGQEIGYLDEALPDGRTYHLVLTFSVYQNALE